MHTSRHCACHVARVSRCRRKVPCGETEREVGETPGMPAGRTGGAGMVGGAPAPITRAPASGLRLGAARATWRAGRGAWARPCRASGIMSGGPLRAGTGRRGRGATTRAPSAPASRSPGARPAAVRRESHGVAGMPPTGARRQRPPARRGNAAVVTGPYGASLDPPATPGDLYFVARRATNDHQEGIAARRNVE